MQLRRRKELACRFSGCQIRQPFQISPEVVNKLQIIEDCGRNPQMKLGVPGSIPIKAWDGEQLGTLVTEELLAFIAEKTADHRDMVIALLENELAGDQACPPFINLVSVLAAVSVNVFLRNAVNDRANFGPHASPGAHGTGLMRGIKDKVGKVAAITAANILEHFQFDMFDAGSRSFYPVASAGNDGLASATDARNDCANGIVASVAGTFGLRDGKLHELLFGLIRSRDHAIRLYEIIASVPHDIRGVPVTHRPAPRAGEGNRFPQDVSNQKLYSLCFHVSRASGQFSADRSSDCRSRRRPNVLPGRPAHSPGALPDLSSQRRNCADGV